jgi:threonine dehydrogenase-like Zn-dependent dehydrogenase
MRCLWLEDGALRLRDDVARPEPPPGEALVRVSLVGVCNTDLELLRGYYPYRGVPGHEFVGCVEAAPGAEQWVGRRVVGEINAWCGACATCRAGRRTHCERRTVLGIVARDGAMAEWLTLPVRNLLAVPDGVPDEVAVFTEPLAAALEIMEQVPIGPGLRALVVGDGKLGQLVARVLALTGCDLRVIGRHPRKLALLAELEIRTAPSGEAADLLAEGKADLAVECTGNPEGFALARAALRPRGTLVLKSTYHGAATIDLSSIVVDEITVLGSRCGPFGPALRLLAEGAIDPRPLIDARFPIGSGTAAFAEAARPGVLKVLIDPGA